MTISRPSPARRRAPRHRLMLAAALACAASLMLAAPAGAVVKGSFGVTERKALAFIPHALQYHGGHVLHSSDAYVVYWDPIGTYRGDWERLIDKYFFDVGGASGTTGDVFALDGQYSDSTGRASNQSTFAGSFKDENPYPSTGNCTAAAEVACLTDAQIQAELQRLISTVDPPLPGASGTPVYYILTPPGVTVCTNSSNAEDCSWSTQVKEQAEEGEKIKTGICGYHSSIGGTIPYAVQPWVAGFAGYFLLSQSPVTTSGVTTDELSCQDNEALHEPNQLPSSEPNPFGNYAEGLADIIVNQLSIEQQNVVTNPFNDGWYLTGSGREQGDMGQFAFGPNPEEKPKADERTHALHPSNETIGPDHFYVQWAFDSARVSRGEFTDWSGAALEPFFTAPNPVNSGDYIGFNATESNVALDANPAHLAPDEPYAAAIYSWNFGDGNTASGATLASAYHAYTYGGSYEVTLTITDSGGNVATTTHKITVNGPAAPGSGAGSSAGGAGAGGAGTHPTPVVKAQILSHSLKTARHKGLVVHYSVSEQVAGHFEVLLSRSLARHLGIHGATATGLPAGSAPESVIGSALLVTTHGGQSNITIQFSKHTAAALGRLGRVYLVLRLAVRGPGNPTVATAMAAATLAR